MKTAYRVPKGPFGPSGFQSQDAEQNSPITSIRVNSLVVDPAPGATLPVNRRSELLGIAWDGGSGISNVEVSLDGDASWREARLGRDLGRYSWRQRRFSFKPAQVGAFTLMARARARGGSTQADTLIANPAGYHHNLVQKADFHAA